MERGGTVPDDLAVRATRPGLVLLGGDSPEFMLDVGRRLADLLPDACLRVLEGLGHVVAPEILTPVVADFLSAQGTAAR